MLSINLKIQLDDGQCLYVYDNTLIVYFLFIKEKH